MVNSDKENFNEEEIVVDKKKIITMENSEKTCEIDGYLWLHCPVCGNEVMDYDICDICHWQNTGIINIDGGPNKMTLAEAKEAYAKGLPIR